MRRLELIQPILRPAELESLKHMEFGGWSTRVLDATWPISEGATGMQAALQRICTEATAAIEAGYEFIVLSDRNQGGHAAALTALLTFTSLSSVTSYSGGSSEALLHSWTLVAQMYSLSDSACLLGHQQARSTTF